MKTKNIALSIVAIILSTGLLFVSCRKKDKEEKDKDTSTASDHSYAENMSNDIFAIGSQGIGSGGSGLSTYKIINPMDGTMMGFCVDSIVLNTTAKTLMVKFNPAIPCNDGRIRSGKLIFDFSQSTNGATAYRHPGFKCIVTGINYTVDGYAITINNKVIENTTAVGFNPASTNITWTDNTNLTINKPNNGGTITWNCSKTTTLLNTSDTTVYKNASTPINWFKARVGINGSSNGTSAGGTSFTANITQQLVRDFNCAPLANRPHFHPFIAGEISFTPGNLAPRIINYGSGACDATVTITVNGYTATLTIQ